MKKKYCQILFSLAVAGFCLLIVSYNPAVYANKVWPYPPKAPSDFSATLLSDTEVMLRWSSSVSCSGFQIFKNPNALPGPKEFWSDWIVTDLAYGDASHTDENGNENNSYYYKYDNIEAGTGAYYVMFNFNGPLDNEYWSAPSNIVSAGYIWKTGPSPTLEGSINITDPSGINNLHYGGTGSPESAELELVISSAQDTDDKYFTSGDGNEEYEDSQTFDISGSEDVEWRCSSSNDSVCGYGSDCSFTPGNSIETNAKVYAKIGDEPSKAHGEYTNEIASPDIKVFKVGVRIGTSSDYDLYEDSENPYKSGSCGSDYDLASTIDHTSGGPHSGAITGPIGSINQECTWKTITLPSCTDIIGNIGFNPSIIVELTHNLCPNEPSVWIWDHASAICLGGTTKVITAMFQAAGVPSYVTALVSLTCDFSTFDSCVASRVRGASTIENTSTVHSLDVGEDHIHGNGTPGLEVNIGSLALSGSRMSLKPNSSKKGSICVKSQTAMTDYVIGNQSKASVEPALFNEREVKFGCSIPNYE